MSENEAVPQPITTAGVPSSSERAPVEKSLDAIVGTPVSGAAAVNMANPTPEGEDFDA